MLAALRDAGVRSHLVEVPDARHGFPFDAPQHRLATCTTLAFLEQLLALPSSEAR
jgi:acetyl esterase/lipase